MSFLPGLDPRALKARVKSLTNHELGARLLCPVLGLGLSAIDRRRVRVSRSGDEFRFELDNGVVIYSTEFDLLVQSRLVAEATTYYLRRQPLAPGNIVVDAGASIGTFAFVAAERVGPTGVVIAVEAHPQSFERLRRSVHESSFDNIVCIHAALVETDGEVLIAESADDYRLNALSTTGAAVVGRSLTSLLDELEYPTIDLLKMNIEGAEAAALLGASAAAAAGRIRGVAVSCHDFMAELTGEQGFCTRDLVTGWLGEYAFDASWGSEFSTEAPLRDYVWAESTVG